MYVFWLTPHPHLITYTGLQSNMFNKGVACQELINARTKIKALMQNIWPPNTSSVIFCDEWPL